MADAETHQKKAKLAWTLTQELLRDDAPGFLTINQAMYAVGHLLEYHLAKLNMHPSASARGVPHSERGRLSRVFLVPAKVLTEEEMTRYDRLFAQRDTFCDGGYPDPKFVHAYVAEASTLVEKLR
jgi:hypothetical protein